VSPEDDDKTEQQIELHTIAHGHSTPRMAGRFARLIGAKSVALTHFSPRYRGDVDNEATRAKMEQIVAQAKSEFGSDAVYAAYDLMTIELAR
jgi:ribonuclease Z